MSYNAGRTVVVKSVVHKNRLDLFCKTYYGYYNESIMNAIIEQNPHLNIYENGFNIGDEVYLPEKRRGIDG